MDQPAKKTPLYQVHQKLGAMMANFGGWQMPIRYVGDKKEHLAVRERVGIFDVCHMGEFLVRGPSALPLLQHVTCNDISQCQIGQAQYNVLTTDSGGFVDDLLIYKIAEEDYFVVVNAGNIDKDFQWISRYNQKFGADLVNASEDYALLAVQGPKAVDVLEKLCNLPLRTMPYYHFQKSTLNKREALISRTGYTASDGFEVYCAAREAEAAWNEIIHAGEIFGIQPCGLSARDSLRIEGKMPLYGMDMDENITVLEANLGRIIKFYKGDFVGKSALLQQLQQGVQKKWIGFEMVGQGIARHGYPVFLGEKRLGEVSSGTFSPTFEKGLGMAYVPPEFAVTDTQIEIEIRQKRVLAKVAKTPFYKITRAKI